MPLRAITHRPTATNATIAAILIAEKAYSTAPNSRTLARFTASSARANPAIHHKPGTPGAQ